MIRIALPTGDLRRATAAALDDAGLGIAEYAAGARALRFPWLDGSGVARVFREKDIPVQVALGNYDLGICGRAWVEELTQRFPQHDVVRLRDLPYGERVLWLASAGDNTEPSVRIVSEYPTVAAAVARALRLRRYRVFGVLGAAEAYPPEDADLALISAPNAAAVEALALRPLARVLDTTACVIVNRRSLATKDLTRALAPLLVAGRPASGAALTCPRSLPLREAPGSSQPDVVRLALPDGHQQPHAMASLRAAGIAIRGYDEDSWVRRPSVDMPGVEVKVIRPQDMPQQVALGNFDAAVTGRDVLSDHLLQFPTSPVREALNLGRSCYGLAAIVKDVPATTVSGALDEWRRESPQRTIRIASEYPNIADHFARDRHFGRYSVIPIAGASEGFVPEDAEILIEGIETGSSVRANKLTVLERFFESTSCVVVSKRRPDGPRAAALDALIDRLRAGVPAADTAEAVASAARGA